MSRMVFADPFGNYTQGFREGQQDELALGMYNLNARRAGTDYDKALQDLRTGEYEHGLRQTLDPLRVRSAEAQLFGQETAAGALGARMTRDPRVMQRAFSYFGPDYGFDEFGNVTTPGGRLGVPARTFLEGADFDFAALPGARQGQAGVSGPGPWAVDYGFNPFSPTVVAPAAQEAPVEQPVPQVPVQSATAPPPSPSIPSGIGFGLGDIFQNYRQAFHNSAAAVAALRDAYNYAPAQPLPEFYGPPSSLQRRPFDDSFIR